MRGVLSNCACLGEGVDVPTLDGIAFIDPRRSMVDIIQAVGRVIRKSDDKEVATVVIPVFVDEGQDANVALSSSAFEPVWSVLRALRAHDKRLAYELDELRCRIGKRPATAGRILLPDRIKIDLPSFVGDEFVKSFYVRTVERTTGLPVLTSGEILEWADSFFERENKWPRVMSGSIPESPGESWNAIHQALRNGARGLPGDSSLARFLEKERGVRNIKRPPKLSPELILHWADSYFERHKAWPKSHSGSIPDAAGETWAGVNGTLVHGGRGMPEGSTLAKFLQEYRDVRNRTELPPLTLDAILAWADHHKSKTGTWPKASSDLYSAIPRKRGVPLMRHWRTAREDC